MNPLNPEEERVIIHKGTERPFTGEYDDHYESGVYLCRQCNTHLYFSHNKFHSGCGWPSFDDAIPKAVKKKLDADGHRVEILCNNCDGHLGHVFEGEQLTAKNTRHCVNSISMKFVPQSQTNLGRAIFAFGCFWSRQVVLGRVKGVIATRVGYTGGTQKQPTSREVSYGKTGHAESVEVFFDKSIVTFEELAKLFFETHNPANEKLQGEQHNGKYRSAIFYTNTQQKEVAEKLVGELKEKGLNIQTQLAVAEEFYAAEAHHQDYYEKLNKEPEELSYTKRF